MTNEELREKISKAQIEIDNISYELSKLVEQKASGQISEENFKVAENELKELLEKNSKELTDYRIQLESKDVKLEQEVNSELSEEVLQDQAENNEKIAKAKQELEVAKREFEKYTKVMQDTHQYTSKRLQNGPLSNDEMKETYDDYYAAMYGNEAVWKEYKSTIARIERSIKRLEKKNKEIETQYEESQALEMDYSEYKEIMKTLESRKRLREILEKKGLGDILHKRGGRSKEERRLIKEATEEVVKEITNVMKKDKELTILDAINVLYNAPKKAEIKEPARTLVVPNKLYTHINDNIKLLPAAVQSTEEIVKEVTKDTPKAPSDIPRAKVIGEGYRPDEILYKSRGMTEDEYIIAEFEEKYGIKFDPEIHEIRKNHDASGTVSDDEVYSTYEIIEKEKHLPQEEPKEEKIEEIVIGDGYVPDRIEYESRGMTEDEFIIDKFEKESGIKFNPEIHEIRKNHDASGIVSDDNVYSTYEIIEKRKVEPTITADEMVEEEKEVHSNTDSAYQIIKETKAPNFNTDQVALPGETIDGKRVGFGDERDGVIPRLPEIKTELVPIEEKKDDAITSEEVEKIVSDEMENVPVEEEQVTDTITSEEVEKIVSDEMENVPVEEEQVNDEITPEEVQENDTELDTEAIDEAISEVMESVPVEEEQQTEPVSIIPTDEELDRVLNEEMERINAEKEQQEEVVLFDGAEPEPAVYTSRGMTEDEYIISEFEKQTGQKFDPEKHELVYNHDASGTKSDDNVHSTFKIRERIKEKEPVPEPKPEPQPEPVPEPKPEPQPEPVPEPKPEPQPEPVPEPKPEPQPGPVPEPKPEPQPGPVPEPKPEPQPEPDLKIPRALGIREIIDGKICKDLDITRKDASKYQWSNARVWKTFVDELHSGNVVYNILHVVPGVLKMAGSGVMKLAKGIFGTKKANDLVNEMKDRIDKLSPEELELLFEQYRGGFIVQEGYPQVINMVIEEKMNEYILGKAQAINNELTAAYRIVLTNHKMISGIDEKLRDKSLDPTTRKKLKTERKRLLDEAASNCMDIKALQVEGRKLLSGGLHGMSEDMKASLTKMNLDGMRFAKTYDYDNELEGRLRAAETQYLDGVHNKDSQAILSGFMKEERLLSENTYSDETLIGRISKGQKHYSPLIEQLDYNKDPLVKDLFTTIAVTTAAISAANAIRVNIEQHRILEAHQQEIARVNAANNQTMGQVNQTGAEIAGKRDVFSEGMRAQAEQNVLSRTNVHERASLDQTDWTIGTDQYHILDHARHDAAQQFYTDTYMQMTDVSTRYAQGMITQDQALQELANIATSSHKTFTDTVTEVLKDTESYAAAHPQHDLTAVLGTMRYFSQHTDAISQMNQGMVDVTNLGESLIGLTAEQATAISSLPSDLGTTLLAAASATALAYNVARDFDKKVKRTKSQENEVTAMMDELNESEKEEVMEEEHTK